MAWAVQGKLAEYAGKIDYAVEPALGQVGRNIRPADGVRMDCCEPAVLIAHTRIREMEPFMDSRDNRVVRTVLAFCVVIVVLVCIRVVPRWWAERIGRRAAHEAVAQAVANAATQATDDVTRRVAREMADQVVRDIAKGEGGAASRAAAVTYAASPTTLLLDRAAFRITLPERSMVDPDDPDLGRERFTTVNLPNGGTMMFVVADAKDRMTEQVDSTASRCRAKFANVSVRNTETFDPAKAVRSTAVTGVLKGERFVLEFGECDGRQKAVLIIVEYAEAKRSEIVEMVRRALGTFEVKG